MNMKKLWRPSEGWKATTAALAAAELAIFLLAELCYKDMIFALPLQAALLPAHGEFRRWMKLRRRRQYIEGFREMLRSFMTSLQAGLSMENACRTARKDLEEYFGKSSHPILVQIDAICRGLDLNIGIEELFGRFADQTGIQDIHEFAAVMETARKSGGDLVEIMRNTSSRLQVKMDTTEEIRACLSGIQLEKNIMLVMPLIMLVYLNMTGASYTSVLYESSAGRIVMSLLLIIMVCCYYWTEAILKKCSIL